MVVEATSTEQADKEFTKDDLDFKLSTKTENGDSARAKTLWREELAVREEVAMGATSNPILAFLVHFYSSVHIFAAHLISLESILSISLSVGMTIYTYNQKGDDSNFDGSIMDWVLLSFAVITPMSASIGMAFTRREQALQHLAGIKTTLWNIYSAHACWDWPKAGKANTGRVSSEIDWLEHNDQVLLAILLLCQELARLLTLPNSSRARHRVTAFGKEEAQKITSIRERLHRSIYGRVNRLTSLCEILKKEGLPPNEATRIRQWERFVTERVEMLVMIKKYRTPQALRSFARLFSLLLPPFYAPFYGQMAIELQSLGVAIAFSIFTSIALSSLFESISQMEDPFVGIFSLDGIDVANELGKTLQRELLDCRQYHYPNAKVFSGLTESSQSGLNGVSATDLHNEDHLRFLQVTELPRWR